MITFYTSRKQYFDHVAPIYRESKFDKQFVVEAEIAGAVGLAGINPILANSPSVQHDCVVVSSLQDLFRALGWHSKHIIFMEHGVGITPSKNAGYAGGTGMREDVSLFLAPNEYIKKKIITGIPRAKVEVIGTPKMDQVFYSTPLPRQQVPQVVVSFHWDGSQGISPEAGNAFEHFKKEIPTLGMYYDLYGHGHPRFMHTLAYYYANAKIPIIHDFFEVMQRADLYVNDCSSTLYEFCVTGKPVVILNSPKFRRDVHWGIRFWDYTDIGPMVDDPKDLASAVFTQLKNPDQYKPQREAMVKDLYPFLGTSAKIATEAIDSFRRSVGL